MTRESAGVLSRATPLFGAEAGPLCKRNRRPLGLGDAGGARDVEGRGDVLTAEAGGVHEHVALRAHLVELATRHRKEVFSGRDTVERLPFLLITVEGRPLRHPARRRRLNEAVVECQLWVMVRHCDTGQARGPIRDTGQGRSDVGQDAVHVILHPD